MDEGTVMSRVIGDNKRKADELTDQQVMTLLDELDAGATLGEAAKAAGIESEIVAFLAFNKSHLEKMPGAFSVVAGKYDGDEISCKVATDHNTLDEAIERADELAGYPWVFIQHGTRFIEPTSKGFDPFKV